MNMIPVDTLLKDDQKKARLFASIARLKGTREFEIVIDFVNDVLNNIDVMNRSALTPNLQWQQGAAQLMAELLKLVESAEALAATYRQRVGE